jgi:cysteine-S-conjugate beta-lyase
VDGPAFGAGGEGAFRLNFATPQPILTEMVERMAAVLLAAV